MHYRIRVGRPRQTNAWNTPNVYRVPSQWPSPGSLVLRGASAPPFFWHVHYARYAGIHNHDEHPRPSRRRCRVALGRAPAGRRTEAISRRPGRDRFAATAAE
jgi:hypothetical protein